MIRISISSLLIFLISVPFAFGGESMMPGGVVAEFWCFFLSLYSLSVEIVGNGFNGPFFFFEGFYKLFKL